MKQVTSDKKVVLFGELMMRLSTKRHERIVQAREFDVIYSGAEANLGVALAAFGIESFMVSSVPDNAVGQACLNYMRQFGLNLDHVRKNGHRLGIYFVETGAAQRPSTFLYNRKGSSITELCVAGYRLGRRLSKASTGSTSRGSPPPWRKASRPSRSEACVAAKRKGVTISCDLNFRRKLWSPEKAREVMTGLMEYVDVLFTNEEEAETVFGIAARGTDVKGGKISARGYEDVAVQLHDRFHVSYVSISLRESLSATANNWSGMLYDGKRFYTSREYHMDYIVDRIGGGDAYSSGIIYGLLTGQDLQESVDFAAAASCLKHTIHGDFNLVTFDEVLALMGGDASGRILR